MATGRLPFEGRSMHALIGAAMGTPPLAHAVSPGVPPHASATLARCLQADRAARPASVAEVGAGLLPA